jgi:predicted N-acetyltransferase YhbS
MADLLVPLYGLPEIVIPHGFAVRKPMASEALDVQRWISNNFSAGWASEVMPALCRTPASMFIAVDSSSGKPAGFCAWDCTALGFLGPVGTSADCRSMGVGGALVLSTYHAMRQQGYGYAIVGDAGPTGFFMKISRAIEIEHSKPGVYQTRIK